MENKGIVCVIIADSIDDTQRVQIQSDVEKRSDSWWNQMTNVWIVESTLFPGDWIDLFGVIIPREPPKLLVVRLPNEQGDRWATLMASKRTEWLKEHLTGQVVPKETRGD